MSAELIDTTVSIKSLLLPKEITPAAHAPAWDAENGRMAVVHAHGVLFRGAAEGKPRQLVEMNLLDAVIGLPANLFYGTGIPACILVFKKNRTCRDVY